MRFVLVRFDGPPPQDRPVGMKDIVAIGNYAGVSSAERHMQFPKTTKVFSGKPATHLGLYDHQDRLVKEYKL